VAEAAVAPEGGEPGVGARERLLRELLAEARVAHHPAAHADQAAGVAADHARERVGVAGERALDRVAIRNLGEVEDVGLGLRGHGSGERESVGQASDGIPLRPSDDATSEH
jgi:hypothetical protein